MSTVKIRTRLHIPDAPVGSVIEVDEARAARLVNARYAVYVSDDAPTTADAPPAPEQYQGPEAAPVTELPNVSDVKAEWEQAAQALGISLEREDGSTKTKDELVSEVTAAVE